MNARRARMISRGLTNACPSCGAHTLFVPGHLFRIAKQCERCGLAIDRGGGFFLGPVALNYGFTGFGFILPLVVLGVTETINSTLAVVLAGVAAIGLPMLLYRLSWSIWVAGFYFFQPSLVPAAGRPELDDPEF